MRITTRAAAVGVLSIAFLVPAGAASAQYIGGGDTEVPPDNGEVIGEDATREPAAVEAAPSGTLPITGGDVVGLTVAGGSAIAVGAVLVHRSRRAVTA
jgi:hypothetical protein